MNVFYDFLSSIVTVSKEDWQYISSFIRIKEFKKNSYVLRPGEVEKYRYFVEFGTARKYYIDKTGKEICLYFALKHSFMDNASSFLWQLPSNCYVQTLAPTRALAIHYNDLQKIYDNTECADKIGRMATEQFFLQMERREMRILTQTPDERYLDLCDNEPEILKQIPLKYIASYLGLTPQALSRIRKRTAPYYKV